MFCTTCCIKYCCKYVKRIDWAAMRSHVAALENAWKCCCYFFSSWDWFMHAWYFLWIKRREKKTWDNGTLTFTDCFSLRRHERGMRGRCTDQRGAGLLHLFTPRAEEKEEEDSVALIIYSKWTPQNLKSKQWHETNESLWAPLTLTLNILWKYSLSVFKWQRFKWKEESLLVPCDRSNNYNTKTK